VTVAATNKKPGGRGRVVEPYPDPLPPTAEELLDELSRIFHEVRPVEGDRAAFISALYLISGLLMYPGIPERTGRGKPESQHCGPLQAVHLCPPNALRRVEHVLGTGSLDWSSGMMISPECASWLASLAAALEQLDAGIVWPVLQPTPICERKPSASYVQYRRAWVAAGVKALIRSGVTRMDAAKQAIREVKSLAGTSPKTVLSRMDEFGKKRGAKTPGANYWATASRDAAQCRTPTEFKRAAAWCFFNANRQIEHPWL
jgi:hypothetical protein